MVDKRIEKNDERAAKRAEMAEETPAERTAREAKAVDEKKAADEAMPRRFPTATNPNPVPEPEEEEDEDEEKKAGDKVVVKRHPNDPHFTYTKIGDSLDIINPLSDTEVPQSPTPKSGAVTEGSTKTPADPKFDR